jgi:hypothetical protein
VKEPGNKRVKYLGWFVQDNLISEIARVSRVCGNTGSDPSIMGLWIMSLKMPTLRARSFGISITRVRSESVILSVIVRLSVLKEVEFVTAP